MKEKRFSDLVIGVAFIVIGIVVFVMASQLQTVKLGIGPGGFPKFISVLLAILGLVMTVGAIRNGIPKPQFTFEKNPRFCFWRLWRYVFCMLSWYLQ